MNELFLEAESFPEKGGWVVDSHSMEQIGSAYVMAHGMGVPVADAYCDADIENGGAYRFFVRTRDWTSVWNVADPAGKFKLCVDGAELPETLGTNGPEWAWQYAGCATLSKGRHRIALRDLTGFNGRCDAIYATDDPDLVPESSREATDALRKRLSWKEIAEDPDEYELAVVGGGVAGVCTALAAIRSGVRTVLIHDRPVLGGCNSSEVRVCMGGRIKQPPYENLGNVVREIAPIMGHPTIFRGEYYEDHRKLAAFEASEGEYKLMLGSAVTDVEASGARVVSVVCTDVFTGKKTRVRAKLFCDASGDGVIARACGAELMYGREASSEYGESLGTPEPRRTVMGQSIRWYSEHRGAPVAFPDIDWNLPLDESSYLNCFSGDWEQETGFERDMINETEYIRDYGLRAIYSNWSYQKNHCPGRDRFADSALVWVSAFGGKRESCRVKGDYIMTQKDLEGTSVEPDGTAPVTWGIDLHFPEPVNEERFGEAFRSCAYHRGMRIACPIPYRCLYSKDVENLFIGGRLVSASHVAFSAIRVMRTLGMLGEVTGLAASVCAKYGCDPRAVYTDHLDELVGLMKKGVPIPDAFACGGVDDGEQYHFKDLGWFDLKNARAPEASSLPPEEKAKALEKFKVCRDRLGVAQRYPTPEEWGK